jgi:hypothetical protein
MHDRDASANRTLADDQLAATGDQCCVTHLHPGDVGYRIKRPCGAADRQLEITLSCLLRVQNAGQREESHQQSQM